jgi:lysophospholipase L1-like esterase
MQGAPIRGNLGQLSYFFNALKKTKNDVVRVAHYGDSAIEGDLITADLREYLRNKNLGGEGVGFLGITSQDIRFRSTTEQSFSDNWESASLYSSNPNELPLGISGEIFIPKGNCWVEYKTKRGFSSVRDFSSVRVFYSHAKSSSIKYSFNDGPSKSARLSPGNGVQELVLKNDGNARKVRIEFEPDQAYFYGVSLENGNGLYVDNLPLRGNSGVDLQKIPESMLKDFHKYLNYKLIILEFGLNIAGSRKSNYSWYEREMTQVINRFKKAFPNTSILMITVHDKSMKRGTQFVTDPSILKLLETQKNIAEKNDVAYWNLFEAMGGENSMPKWVSANPPLAFRDYIHFNEQGAQKIAEMLGDAIWDAYNK